LKTIPWVYGSSTALVSGFILVSPATHDHFAGTGKMIGNATQGS
jgi:hypothetical protein